MRILLWFCKVTSMEKLRGSSHVEIKSVQCHY